MKIFRRPENIDCMQAESVTHSDKAFYEPTEIGDFVTMDTDLGEIRARILSIAGREYVGEVVDCREERLCGTRVEFEAADMLARWKSIRCFCATMGGRSLRSPGPPPASSPIPTML